jgi:hypothetical protein
VNGVKPSRSLPTRHPELEPFAGVSAAGACRRNPERLRGPQQARFWLVGVGFRSLLRRSRRTSMCRPRFRVHRLRQRICSAVLWGDTRTANLFQWDDFCNPLPKRGRIWLGRHVFGPFLGHFLAPNELKFPSFQRTEEKMRHPSPFPLCTPNFTQGHPIPPKHRLRVTDWRF